MTCKTFYDSLVKNTKKGKDTKTVKDTKREKAEKGKTHKKENEIESDFFKAELTKTLETLQGNKNLTSLHSFGCRGHSHFSFYLFLYRGVNCILKTKYE